MLNYYLDISEEEYVDTTYTTRAMTVDTNEWIDVMPTYIGFPYRSMK